MKKFRGIHENLKGDTNTSAHKQYKQNQLAIGKTKKANERDKMRQLQEVYDATASSNELRAQLAGQPVSAIPPPSETPLYAFDERARIAQVCLDPPSRSTADDPRWRVPIVNDLVALYTKRESLHRD